MKELSLNLRRIRSSVRTDITTGSRIKTQASANSYASGAAKCIKGTAQYCLRETGELQPAEGLV